MQCTNPVLVFDKKGNRCHVPCGRCLSCRLNHGLAWSIRIMLEAMDYENSIFITLTYSPEELEKNGDFSLHREHLQKFFKAYRQAIAPEKIRFYYCGEYGDQFGRPHYHAVIFGRTPDDKELIEKLWKRGFIKAEVLNVHRARYVAKYMLKKQKGQFSAEYYDNLGICPEFSGMSLKPGIAYNYVKQNMDKLMRDKFLMFNGHKVPIPRYFLTHICQEYPEFKQQLIDWREHDWEIKYDKDHGSLKERVAPYERSRLKQMDNNIRTLMRVKGVQFNDENV